MWSAWAAGTLFLLAPRSNSSHVEHVINISAVRSHPESDLKQCIKAFHKCKSPCILNQITSWWILRDHEISSYIKICLTQKTSWSISKI